MQWRDQTVPIVGVRSRGSGSRNPHKPGLRIDFGRYVDQKFLGLKSLALVNGWQGPSLMKQRISMLFYMGWLEAEALKEIAQFHAAGVADSQKSFSNERMDDELQKVLRFARARGPYVLREAGKGLGWPETDGR